MKKILQGIYRHYKGGKYIILGTATHTENGKRLVVYRDVITEKMWARPEKMFLDKLKINNRWVDRFTKE